jgi:glycosyl transferase, family 25
MMAEAYFEPVVRAEGCRFCQGQQSGLSLSPAVEAIYCISLQEQPRRTNAAAAHFHALGLCRDVLFYRAVRGRYANRAIWESHRAVAQHALRNGFCRVLILEDDVFFTQPPKQLVLRINAAIAALPTNWWALYLGHLPIQAFFVRPDILRVRSGCTHAYVANQPLLNWLAATPPMAAEAPVWRWIGQSIDAAMSSLPQMYALFPMVAVQRFLGDYRVDTRIDDHGRRRALTDVDRWRYIFIFAKGARFAEAMAVLLSPVHWLTLEWSRRHVDKAARRPVVDGTAVADRG